MPFGDMNFGNGQAHFTMNFGPQPQQMAVIPPGSTLWFPAGVEKGVARHLVYTITAFDIEGGEVFYTLDDTDVVITMEWIQQSGLELVLPQQQQGEGAAA